MNIWKSFMWTAEWRIIKEDHRSCIRDLCSCEKEAMYSTFFLQLCKLNAMISCNVLSCCSSKWSYVNYGELHCDLASQDCSLSNDKLQLVFLRLCNVMQPKWSSFCDKFRRRNIFQGELTDILKHLYCDLLCSLVSIMTAQRSAL